ncbi:TPA: phage protein NinX family protein [Providencia alcalifaciens]
MNKYTELSDFEINKKVASHYLPCDYNLNEHTKTVELIGFLGDTDEYNVYGIFDPCNNPADAMTIIIENKIGMNFVNNNIGWSAIHQCIIKGELEVYGKRYYRTAMELFLLMKDAENEG